jgi:hypothetical protein
VREVAQLGGAIKGLVPELVEQGLRAKLDPAYKLQEFTSVEARKSKSRKR